MPRDTIKFSFNTTEYPMEAVYGTAYVLVDRAYLFLENGGKNRIKVSLKGKKKLNSKKLEELKGEFLNELLNYSFRIKLVRGNKKIRDYIISQALLSAIGGESQESEEEMKYEDDPLGIAVPWEEKYGKNHKNTKT